MSRQLSTIYDIFCPVPFLPSPFGFRRLDHLRDPHRGRFPSQRLSVLLPLIGRRTEQAKANLDPRVGPREHPRVGPRVAPRVRPREHPRGLISLFSAFKDSPRNIPRRCVHGRAHEWTVGVQKGKKSFFRKGFEHTQHIQWRDLSTERQKEKPICMVLTNGGQADHNSRSSLSTLS